MKRRSFLKKTAATAVGLSLGASACRSNQKKHTEVLILGAGLSGLYAALLLEKRGIDYQILEGSDRVGGRLYTNDQFSVPLEWGGATINEDYKRVINLANALKVPLVDALADPQEWMIHYHGKNVSNRQWSSDSINPLSDELKAFSPYQLAAAPFTKEPLPVKDISDWHQPYIHTLDYSYRQFLEKKGYGPEAIRLANVAADYNDLGRVSTLQVFRSLGYQKLAENNKRFNIKDGSSRLPEAMAKILSKEVLFNKKATSISDEVRSVKVQCADGSSYSAEKLICTLPFSILHEMNIQANLNNRQEAAIKYLDYTKVTMAILSVKHKFWEQDGLPVAMWTDSPIEQVVPVTPLDADEIFLKVLINGTGAKVADQYSKAGLAQEITKVLHRIRPSTKNSVKVEDSFSWGNHEFSRGAYAEFQTGQVLRFIPRMSERTNRVFFAGAHTSFAEPGMEGALASAERVISTLVPPDSSG